MSFYPDCRTLDSGKTCSHNLHPKKSVNVEYTIDALEVRDAERTGEAITWVKTELIKEKNKANLENSQRSDINANPGTNPTNPRQLGKNYPDGGSPLRSVEKLEPCQKQQLEVRDTRLTPKISSTKLICLTETALSENWYEPTLNYLNLYTWIHHESFFLRIWIDRQKFDF